MHLFYGKTHICLDLSSEDMAHAKPGYWARDACPSAQRPLVHSEWLSFCMPMPDVIQVSVKSLAAGNQQS